MRRGSGEVGPTPPPPCCHPARRAPRRGAGAGAERARPPPPFGPPGQGRRRSRYASREAGSAIAVSVTDAIEGFDLREICVDRLELLAEPFDVTVDCPVIDIDVLAVSGIHQLVAVLDVPWAVGERCEAQELGHGEFDQRATPRAQVAHRIQNQLAADDDRLALRLLALARELPAPDQRTDPLDQ